MMHISFGSRTLDEAKRDFARDVRLSVAHGTLGVCHVSGISSDERSAYALVVIGCEGGSVAFVGRRDHGADEALPSSWDPLPDVPAQAIAPVVMTVDNTCSYKVFWELWHRATRLARCDFKVPGLAA